MTEEERLATETLLGELLRRRAFRARDADLWQWIEALRVAGFELRK